MDLNEPLDNPSAPRDPYLFPDARIIVFAKAPVPGRVKTRLRPAIGARAAAGVYKTLCRDVLTRIQATRCAPMELHVAPGSDHPWLRARAREFSTYLRTQGPGDLGSRMSRALNDALGRCRLAVVIGADCAGLDGDTVVASIQALATGAPVVLVPADDGGYALIGMRKPVSPALFRCIDWGTPRVTAQTRRAARQHHITIRETGQAWDVDDWQDVRRWRRQRSQ